MAGKAGLSSGSLCWVWGKGQGQGPLCPCPLPFKSSSAEAPRTRPHNKLQRGLWGLEPRKKHCEEGMSKALECQQLEGGEPTPVHEHIQF